MLKLSSSTKKEVSKSNKCGGSSKSESRKLAIDQLTTLLRWFTFQPSDQTNGYVFLVSFTRLSPQPIKPADDDLASDLQSRRGIQIAVKQSSV